MRDDKAGDWLLYFYNTHGGEALNLYSFSEAAKRILFDDDLLTTEVKSMLQHKQEMDAFIRDKFQPKTSE